MKPIMLRYIIPSVVYSIIAFFLWVAVILSVDGFLPFLFGLAFFVVVVGSIPYCIYRDYKLAVQFVKDAKDVYNSQTYKTPEFYIGAAKHFAVLYGVPEFIAVKAMTYAQKKLS